MNGELSIVNVSYDDFLGQFLGGLAYSGRVAVCQDGVFGSVCDVNWDQNDANVFCNSDFGLDGDYGESSLLYVFICWHHNGMHSSFRYMTLCTCIPVY